MGEGIRREGGGEEGKLGRKTGAAEVEAYEALPRRTGTAGNGQGTVGDGGRQAEDGDRGRLERGQEPLATACAHYQLSPKSSRQTRSLTLRNGSKYAFLRHDKAGGYNLPRTEHCNAGVL